MNLQEVKVGDVVVRKISSDEVLMQLKVTHVTEDKVVCGAWEFDRETGVEIDEDLHWGPKYGRTGSYIQPQDTNSSTQR